MKPQTVIVAGASGLIGTALVEKLRAENKRVVCLVRRPARSADEVQWAPAQGQLPAEALSQSEAVINLAGRNVSAGPWTRRAKAAIRQSRIEATRTIVAAVRAASPRPQVLINASAVGFYGETGTRAAAETDGAGSGFLAEVCRQWEAEAELAEEIGVRVVRCRFGLVLSRSGGLLDKMLPVFRAGLGGPLGSGSQMMSWVALEDVVRALSWVLEHGVSGPVNVAAPGAVSNREFTKTLGAVLRRPTVLRVPAFLLKALPGGMGREMFLSSIRAEPRRLVESGFTFRYRELGPCLTELLEAERSS